MSAEAGQARMDRLPDIEEVSPFSERDEACFRERRCRESRRFRCWTRRLRAGERSILTRARRSRTPADVREVLHEKGGPDLRRHLSKKSAPVNLIPTRPVGSGRGLPDKLVILSCDAISTDCAALDKTL